MQPSDFLNRIKRIADSSSEKKSNGKAGIITSIVMAIATLVALAVFAFVANRKSKELARLRHEKNKAEIHRATAETNAKHAKNEAHREALEEKIGLCEAQAAEIEKDIKAVESARKEDQDSINSITSWNDV